MDDATFQQAGSTFQESGEKTWLDLTVGLDGTSHEHCDGRLKGRSTLRRTSSTAGAEQYPWLVRLDKCVDGQDHLGVTEVVVRVNNSASSLNEVVALDLPTEAGLASEEHAYAGRGGRRRVGSAGGAGVAERHLGGKTMAGDGILCKAEATGDHTSRGTDPASYDQVVGQESGGTDDLTPHRVPAVRQREQ